MFRKPQMQKVQCEVLHGLPMSCWACRYLPGLVPFLLIATKHFTGSNSRKTAQCTRSRKAWLGSWYLMTVNDLLTSQLIRKERNWGQKQSWEMTLKAFIGLTPKWSTLSPKISTIWGLNACVGHVTFRPQLYLTILLTQSQHQFSLMI